MTLGTSIAEAARLLEIPEHAVRARVADGTIRVVRPGSGRRPALLDAGDVRAYARRQQLGELGRRMRLVLALGDGLEEQIQALRVAGLEVERASSFLDALDRHGDVPGAPIVVASPEAVNAELGMIQPMLGTLHLAIITWSQTSIPWPVECQAFLAEPVELRRLVQWAWGALDARTEAGRLKL